MITTTSIGNETGMVSTPESASKNTVPFTIEKRERKGGFNLEVKKGTREWIRTEDGSCVHIHLNNIGVWSNDNDIVSILTSTNMKTKTRIFQRNSRKHKHIQVVRK